MTTRPVRLPIGLRLQRPKNVENNINDHVDAGTKQSVGFKSKSLLSIDEQIKLLESRQEESNNETSTSEDDESNFSSENESDREIKPEPSFHAVKDSQGKVVRLVSSLEETDKIQPLSKKYLPAARCNNSSLQGDSGGQKTKRLKFSDEQPPKESGMEKTVRELLANYEPVSHQDKKPFYCRICKTQSSNLEEFEAHKLSEFHLVAVKVERNYRFCKHCQKEFTSPDQLKGHMEGKAHKEQVARLAARKRGVINGKTIPSTYS